MALTPEQIKEFKEQLVEQIKNLPEDKKKQAYEYIESMSPEVLESMVKQQAGDSAKSGRTIFRMIAEREIESYVVEENAEIMAVLDINPISKGHCLVIPKKPVLDEKALAAQALTLTNELVQRLKAKLKAKAVELQIEKKFGEAVIHLIPVYDEPLTLESPRQSTAPDALKKLAADLMEKEKIKEPEPEKISLAPQPDVPKKPLKLPRRIP